MAKFDHERSHMAANLVSDPPVYEINFNFKLLCITINRFDDSYYKT